MLIQKREIVRDTNAQADLQRSLAYEDTVCFLNYNMSSESV